jgi:hypothetical protein
MEKGRLCSKLLEHKENILSFVTTVFINLSFPQKDKINGKKKIINPKNDGTQKEPVNKQKNVQKKQTS